LIIVTALFMMRTYAIDLWIYSTSIEIIPTEVCNQLVMYFLVCYLL